MKKGINISLKLSKSTTLGTCNLITDVNAEAVSVVRYNWGGVD